MADVPISDALIDSAQFQIQSVPPATPGGGLVRLFRFTDGWAEKLESGGVRSIEGPLRASTVRLTSADLLALDTVTKVLVDAPGSGKLLLPIFWSLVPHPGGAPYSVGAGHLRIGYTLAPHFDFADTTEISNIWQSGIGENVYMSSITVGVLDTFATLVNQPLALRSSTPLTGGDGDADVTVIYFIL